jgi:NAD(P)H-nitrite reductase large subunit
MAKHHLIIGAGPVATNAIETIRQFNSEDRITLVSDEPAHSRMALPYWLSGQIPRMQTHTGDADYFAKLSVETCFGERVQTVDTDAKSVTLDNGTTLGFDNLLIATGSSPTAPPIPGTNLSGVQPLWNLEQTASALDGTAAIDTPHVVLVGAGFIGFIVLNAMFKRGWKLTVVERESQVLPRMLDGPAAELVQKWLNDRGVAVHVGAEVEEITNNGGTKSVRLSSGDQITADLIILATGIQPNTQLIQGTKIVAGAEGILVDDQMQTNVPGIYAGGDVAQGPVLGSDEQSVHAIQTTAVDHGRVAGANMAGKEIHYPGSLLMNVVDVCGLQNASYGQWDATDGDAMTMHDRAGFIYRKLVWRGDQLVGALFSGRHNDMGMLTDLGMVKGMIQTQTEFGQWKEFLRENPFDVRRAFIGTGVAQRLAESTLLGEASRPRQYRFGNAQPSVSQTDSHAIYLKTRAD